MAPKPPLLLYIHGFNSSPGSHKALVMREYCQQHRPDIKVVVPQMACYPRQASEQLEDLVQRYQHDYHIGLVGSSLGGYLSTWLNSLYGYKAVLVNPAVRPYELLADYLGEQVNPYTDEKYWLKAQHMTQLKQLEVAQLAHASDFWLLQQKGDEVLDYRQAVEKYQACLQTVEEGGDHSFINFERYPEQIIKFLAL